MTKNLKYRNLLFLLATVLCSLLSYYGTLANFERPSLRLLGSTQIAALAYGATVILFADETPLTWKGLLLMLGALACCGVATSVTMMVMSIPNRQEWGIFGAYFAGSAAGAVGFMLCCRLMYHNISVKESLLLALLAAALAAGIEMAFFTVMPRETDMAPFFGIIIPWQILFTLALIIANR